jgi:hypothetical protein
MTHRADRRRTWVVLLIGLALWGSLPLAIELNGQLAAWSFISFEHRNILLFISITLVFGIVSETRPFRAGRSEAFDGVLLFGLFILVGVGSMIMRGLWLGLWTLLPPLLFFGVQAASFVCGRWIGRIPHRKAPNPAAEG